LSLRFKNRIALSGEQFIIKLLDFGFSSKIKRNEDGSAQLQTKYVGTEGYAAPEVLNRIPYDGELADIFSLGVILFNLRTSFIGFEKAKCYEDKRYNCIRYKKYNNYWELLGSYIDVDQLSEQFRKLYLKMVAYNPKERPTLGEIFNDDYFDDIRALNEDQLQALEQEIITEFRNREALVKDS